MEKVEYYKKTLNDSSLEFIIDDCYKSIKAMPNNEKVPEYYNLAKELENELYIRHSKRIFRKQIKRYCLDPLTFPVRKYRNRLEPLDFKTRYLMNDIFHTANFELAYYKKLKKEK